ncbi:hypothetical protein K466DRAFT_338350 [Polyporus arcularius HHB13444]|uniref:Uncharacterized protein n=1 Tax=Polyporus arcularius HHB13444 TaxID=1314778 RepID=A0A5C3PQ21_9APHY|nr:hypothetical protein K466DRAFT_338350 [Polyporus arcularius HHB13444]
MTDSIADAHDIDDIGTGQLSHLPLPVTEGCAGGHSGDRCSPEYLWVAYTHSLEDRHPPCSLTLSPMSNIDLSNARLVGLWLQLFATGAYFVYLAQCVEVLRGKRRDGMSLWLPIVCALMFVITMITDACDMVLAYEAFSSSPGRETNPWKVYADVGGTLSLLKNASTIALAIISDCIIVYRTFLVWGSKIPVVLIPVVLLFADIAFGVWSAWTLSQTHNGDNAITAAVSVRVRYFFVITFTLNVLCAGLICWKIWRVHSGVPANVANTIRSPTGRVFEVIIETAALYCTHLLILIVSDGVGSNLFFLFLDPVRISPLTPNAAPLIHERRLQLPPVTALVFTMIIVRASTRSRFQPTTTPSEWLGFWHRESGSHSLPAAEGPGRRTQAYDVEGARCADLEPKPNEAGDGDGDGELGVHWQGARRHNPGSLTPYVEV